MTTNLFPNIGKHSLSCALLLGGGATPVIAADLRLNSIHVSTEIVVGTPYIATLSYENVGKATLKRICFLRSGKGPFCFKKFQSDPVSKVLYARLHTKARGTHTLVAYVEYRAGDKKEKSNELRTTINVLARSSSSNSDAKPFDACRFPDGFAVRTPENAPQGTARFSGIFEGKWEGQMEHSLIVDEIGPDGSATGYYAWGRYPVWKFYNAGCSSFTGKVSDGQLRFQFAGAQVTYHLDGEDTIRGAFLKGGRTTNGVFLRR